MLRFVKIFGYKGIKNITLEELGHINVFCGKNSSGKSSVLEGIISVENSIAGLDMSLLREKLESEFMANVRKYSNPHFSIFISWFQGVLHQQISRNPIWYVDESAEIVETFKIDWRSNPNLRVYNFEEFKVPNLIASLFQTNKKKVNAVLIPPKRQVSTKASINFAEGIQPSGSGLLNKLFFLKNQELKSDSFVTFQKIYEAFKSITGYSFNVIPQTDNGLILNLRIKEEWISADQCGLGLTDLLFLITYVLGTNYDTYLIEEPESHLHADFQKRLLRLFSELDSKQFLLSTHSNVFLDSESVNKLYYCWVDQEGVKVSDKTSLSKIVDSLGYSITENLTCDAIILTEGPTDTPILKRVLTLAGVLEGRNIKFWPLGGDIMGSLDLSIFSNVKNVIAVIDADPGSRKIRETFKNNCRKNNIRCVQLERYSIENYIPLSLIREAFPGQIPDCVTSLAHNKSVDEQIGFKEKAKSIKGKNFTMAANLKLEHVQGTDLWKLVEEIKESIKIELNSRVHAVPAYGANINDN